MAQLGSPPSPALLRNLDIVAGSGQREGALGLPDRKQVDERLPKNQINTEAAHFLGADAMLAGGLNVSHRRLPPRADPGTC